MWLLQKRVQLCALVILDMGWASYGDALTKTSPTDVLKEIKKSEDRIRDMQASVRWWQPETGHMFKDFEWGYAKGKEFLDGTQYADQEPRSMVKFAFDGKTQFHFRDTVGADFPGGRICALEPEVWNGNFTPAALLGYSLNGWGRQTLADFLSTASDLRVHERMVLVDGHACLLLEAVGLSYRSPKGNTYSYDVRVWVDPARDYRPLKMEKYAHVAGTGQEAEQNRWKQLERRYDNIRLAKFDGLWFPVSGDRQAFSTTVAGSEGMSKEEFRAKYVGAGYTEEELFEKGILRHVTEPTSPKRRIAVSNIRINKGIAPEAFRIQFPAGCAVWDDFKKVGYIVPEEGGEKRDDVQPDSNDKSKDKTTPR